MESTLFAAGNITTEIVRNFTENKTSFVAQNTSSSQISIPSPLLGWSGGAMVLGKLPVPGRPPTLITVGQGPIALAVGAGGDGLDIFTLICPFSSFSLSLGDGLI